MSDPVKKITFGGVILDQNQISAKRAESNTLGKDSTYVVNFKNGLEVKYPKQNVAGKTKIDNLSLPSIDAGGTKSYSSTTIFGMSQTEVYSHYKQGLENNFIGLVNTSKCNVRVDANAVSDVVSMKANPRLEKSCTGNKVQLGNNDKLYINSQKVAAEGPFTFQQK